MNGAAQSQASQPKLPRWLIMFIICIPVFVGSLDLTVVSAFLPELITDLEIDPLTGIDDAAWVLSAYLLAYTISLTFMGRVSDLIGRRGVYAVSLVIFIAGSMLVAVAHQWPTEILNTLYRRAGERPDIAYVNLQAIIIARVIQAFGAGALVPVSLALVGDLFPPGKRARPVGLVGAVDTLGWVLGHLYGGGFIQIMPWQGLFWMNVPLTLFALVMTLFALRGVPEFKAKGRFDFLGAAFIVGALTCFNIGLGANIDIGSTTSVDNLTQLPPYAGPLLAASVVFLLLFVLIESRVRDPLISPDLFKRRNVAAGSLTNLFVGYCLFIGLVMVPILVNVRQEDLSDLRAAALEVGLLLSALTVPMAIAAIPGGWLSERIGYSKTTLLGLALACGGFLLIWQTWSVDMGDPLIIAEMVVIGVGIGLTFSPISAAVINAAHDDERGVASALVLVMRLIGMTVSVSTLSAFASRRVVQLAEEQLGASISNLSTSALVAPTIDVLSEIGLLGAVLCVVAMLPAALMRPDDEMSPPPPVGDEAAQYERIPEPMMSA